MLCVALLMSCKKSSSASAQTNNPSSTNKKTATYEYEVFCSQGTWSGTYLADDMGWVDIHSAQSGWTYTGKPTYYPAFQTDLVITPDVDSPGIKFTINLYVNSKLVRSDVFTTIGDYGSDHGSVNYNIQ